MTIFVNNLAIETFNFPGGECHIKIIPASISGKTEITAFLNSADAIMKLLLTVDAVRRVNLETKIFLTIPYFPYARQDRVCNQGEALSVKVMADIINSMKCTCVTIYDPHSDVAAALLNNCQQITLSDIISHSFLKDEIIEKNIILVSPDAGAEKKILLAAKEISLKGQLIDVLMASKARDTLTGDIVSTRISSIVENRDYIILDDICDGGRTFIELSKLLKKLGANHIYLYVTHGIFSKGLDIFRENFKHIYCFHTFLKENKIDSSFLTIIGDKNA